MTLGLVMPDVVKMLVGFYRAQPEVVALLGHPLSVRGKLAKDTQYPAIRIFRVTSQPVMAVPHYIEEAWVQLDCYGGNNRQAERLAQVARAALCENGHNYSNSEGVIVGVRPLTMSDQPDEGFTPPRERYVVEMAVRVRPHPA